MLRRKELSGERLVWRVSEAYSLRNIIWRNLSILALLMIFFGFRHV